MIARGPIPAHAGQPTRLVFRCSPTRAYPRSRGATSASGLHGTAGQGLSPLTRGNPFGPPRAGLFFGPIPAHAGQPGSASRQIGLIRAYPRSRGATARPRQSSADRWGLSPLTRGNRRGPCRQCPRSGPIPAHAGQPSVPLCCNPAQGAYPRSRGATRTGSRPTSLTGGLSPLTRGNLGVVNDVFGPPGPIPAHAGQPHSRAPRDTRGGAYPRSRGATSA